METIRRAGLKHRSGSIRLRGLYEESYGDEKQHGPEQSLK